MMMTSSRLSSCFMSLDYDDDTIQTILYDDWTMLDASALASMA